MPAWDVVIIVCDHCNIPDGLNIRPLRNQAVCNGCGRVWQLDKLLEALDLQLEDVSHG